MWLYLIPCFNLIWQFFIATRVPGSLQNEFRDRNRDDGSDYGRSIAMTQAVLGVINVPLSWVGNIVAQTAPEVSLIFSGLSMLMSLVSLVLFIVFWVKIANYSAILAADEGGYRDRRRLDDFRDDDDDRDRRPLGGGSPPSDAIKPEDPGRYQ